jgi:hypothetical protein
LVYFPPSGDPDGFRCALASRRGGAAPASGHPGAGVGALHECRDRIPPKAGVILVGTRVKRRHPCGDGDSGRGEAGRWAQRADAGCDAGKARYRIWPR